MFWIQLLLFSIAWCVVIYAFNSLVARQRISIEPKQLLIYVFTMASLGLFGEVAYGILYNAVFGMPLWEYQVLPIHSSYTSVYSLYLWGMVGFHLYLLHTTLENRGITSVHKLAAIFCLEAIVLEALVNLSFLAAFGSYIYYYLPSDLWHITSLQTLPLYLLAGYITVLAIRFAKKVPTHALAGNSAVITALLVLQ